MEQRGCPAPIRAQPIAANAIIKNWSKGRAAPLLLLIIIAAYMLVFRTAAVVSPAYTVAAGDVIAIGITYLCRHQLSLMLYRQVRVVVPPEHAV